MNENVKVDRLRLNSGIPHWKLVLWSTVSAIRKQRRKKKGGVDAGFLSSSSL